MARKKTTKKKASTTRRRTTKATAPVVKDEPAAGEKNKGGRPKGSKKMPEHVRAAIIAEMRLGLIRMWPKMSIYTMAWQVCTKAGWPRPTTKVLAGMLSEARREHREDTVSELGVDKVGSLIAKAIGALQAILENPASTDASVLKAASQIADLDPGNIRWRAMAVGQGQETPEQHAERVREAMREELETVVDEDRE